MKKTGFFLIALLTCATCFGGTDVVERGSFAASGDGAKFTIPLRKGSSIIDVSLSANVETNQSLVVYRPRKISATTTGASPGTSVFVRSTITELADVASGDFLLIRNASTDAYALVEVSGNSGWTLERGYLFPITSSLTYSIGDITHIIYAEDTLSIPVTTTSPSIQYENLFTGFVSQLVHLEIDAGSGASTVFSGTYNVER